METWSWLGAAVPSREWGLAEQQEFGSGKKKKKIKLQQWVLFQIKAQLKSFPEQLWGKNDARWEALPHAEYLQPKATTPANSCVFYPNHTAHVYEPGGLAEKGSAILARLFSLQGFVCFGRDVTGPNEVFPLQTAQKKKKKMHFFLLLQLCLVVFGRSCTAGQMAIACSEVTTGMRFGGIFRLKNRLQPHSSGWWPTLQTKQDIFTTRAANPQSK